MTIDNRTKINKLINNWPGGAIYTTEYLINSGYSYQLLDFYKSKKWLERIGQGAYKRFGDKVQWQGAINALQKQLGLTIHPGGKTALELTGFAHFLADKMVNFYLFGHRGEKLPRWYLNYNWDVQTHYTANQLFRNDTGLKSYRYREFEILISSPERAILEMLYHFPEYHTFDECFHVMENLTGLQPKLCQNLLEQCNTIKVKRMFLFLAEHAEHSWLDSINTSKLDLGNGKRVLVDGGVYVDKYKITVPKNYKR